MKARRGTFALAALLALALVAVACGGSSGGDSADPGGTAPSTPSGGGDTCTADRSGGSITMGMYTESRGLDPIVMFGSGVAGGIETAAIFDRLMRWDPATGDFTPRLAQSLAPDATFKVWTLKLRPEARFGNGDPVTAEAVKFTIERVQSDANKTQSREAAGIVASTEVVDPLTVRFTLKQEWPDFPSLLADEAGMVVNPTVAKAMTPEDFNKNPRGAGAGAYEPERFAPGDEIVLKAKSGWWGGPVCVQELRFVWVQGGQATYDAFQTGELGMALLREPQIIQEAMDAGVNTYESFQNLGDVLYLNNVAPRPTADVRVRQAIAAAIDVTALDQRVNEGTGIPTKGMVGEGSLYFDPSVDGPMYDPATAQRLVQEAKAAGWDGKLEFLCDNIPVRRELALAVEAQLEAVGIDVETNSNLTITDLTTKTRVDRAFDIACGGLSVNDASPWMRLTPKIGPGNKSEAMYESPEMNAALDRLRLAKDVAERKAALKEMQAIWNRDVPLQNVFTVVEAIIWADDIHGLEFTSKTVVFFDKAWIG